MNKTMLITALALLGSGAAQADSWSCRQGNDVREVHIERQSEDPVPCTVVYRKLTEGVDDQALWNAQFDANYCSHKAEEFVAKLQTWGWTCVETIAEPSEG